MRGSHAKKTINCDKNCFYSLTFTLITNGERPRRRKVAVCNEGTIINLTVFVVYLNKNRWFNRTFSNTAPSFSGSFDRGANFYNFHFFFIRDFFFTQRERERERKVRKKKRWTRSACWCLWCAKRTSATSRAKSKRSSTHSNLSKPRMQQELRGTKAEMKVDALLHLCGHNGSHLFSRKSSMSTAG